MNAICMKCNEWSPMDEILATSCGHTFHRHCLTEWFSLGTKTCPSCSTELSSKGSIQLQPAAPNTSDEDEQSYLLHSSLDSAQALVNYQKDLLNQRDEEFKALKNQIKQRDKVVKENKKIVEQLHQCIQDLNNKMAEEEAAHRSDILELEEEIMTHKKTLDKKEVIINALVETKKLQNDRIDNQTKENEALKETAKSLHGDLLKSKAEFLRVKACLVAYDLDVKLLEYGLSNAMLNENGANNALLLAEHATREYLPVQLSLPLLPLKYEN